MKLQKLYSYTRKAIDDFQMIKENDSIAVGISGGKDSLTLLYALAGLRRFYPVYYSLTGPKAGSAVYIVVLIYGTSLFRRLVFPMRW